MYLEYFLLASVGLTVCFSTVYLYKHYRSQLRFDSEVARCELIKSDRLLDALLEAKKIKNLNEQREAMNVIYKAIEKNVEARKVGVTERQMSDNVIELSSFQSQ